MTSKRSPRRAPHRTIEGAAGRSRRRAVRPMAVIGAALLLTITACGGDGDGGEGFPDVEVVDVDGAEVSTASWEGRPLVVNFWYSTCAPCATELGEFAEVHAERGDEVRFIGVNPLDDTDRMVEFAAERGVAYELFRDELAELQAELGIVAFPATFFVTADGEIVAQEGVLDAEALDARIDELLST